jgi:CRP-like cAMP-binding protein
VAASSRSASQSSTVSGPVRIGRDNVLDSQTSADVTANRLLAALPRDSLALLSPHLVNVQLHQTAPLFEVDDEVEHVFFPLSGMVSLLVVLNNGAAIETATVGREGVVGAMAGLGLHRSRVRAVIQLAGAFARISSVHFRQATAASPAIANMSIRYNEMLLAQARITAACNLSHAIEPRFCRWLLQSRDRAESDVVPLTQEFLSQMLGVRRTSVTEIAIKMQDAKVITYSRGIIKIVDLNKLKAMACECYKTLRDEPL